MSDILHVGSRKGLFTLHRSAKGWEIENVDFLGHPVTMLFEDPRDGSLYACLTLGHFGSKLHRRDASTGEWTEVAVPVYPTGASLAAGPEIDGVAPTPKPANLSEIWSLESAGNDKPGCLWAGTIPGGLFFSSDCGASWEMNEPLWNCKERMQWFGGGKDDPGIHSICVDPRDSQHITLGISCGGIWETHDAGGTWGLIGEGLRAEFMPPDEQFNQGIQDAHRLAQCAANPDVMWVQHHNGIFHSVDASHHFREIPEAGPSTFGFAVCADPNDERTAWFVPAVKDECRVPVDGRLVVTRTRDSGQSFQTLTRGLPDRHCYDIVFRHGLDVDSTGKRLALGSSTGGLWISENAGDDWDQISTTLPQIYTLRFSQLA